MRPDDAQALSPRVVAGLKAADLMVDRLRIILGNTSEPWLSINQIFARVEVLVRAYSITTSTEELREAAPGKPARTDIECAKKVAAIWYDSPTDFINEGPIIDEAARIIRAYITQLEAQRPTGDWLPIESAPRDGTHILLFTTNNGVTEAWFAPGEWSHTLDGDEYSGAVWVCGDDVWSIEVEETSPMYHGEATHWMPLPAPPANDNEPTA